MNPTPNPHTPREFITEPGALSLPAAPRPQQTPREALRVAYVQALSLAASLRRAMDAMDAATQHQPSQPGGIRPNWPT